MSLTAEQLEQAQQMNKEGMSWAIISAYFNTNINKLREQRKSYETNKTIE